MGFWKRLGRRLRRALTSEPPPPPPPRAPAPVAPPEPEPSFDTGDGGLPDPENLPFDFGVAGWLPLGGDFSQDYVNTEGYPLDPDEPDWSNIDYIVVQITEPDGSTYYTTIVGPFDDYDDFYDHLAAWWVEGSPP